MEMLGEGLLINRVALMAFAQVIAAITAFRVNFAKGMRPLTVPGYLLVAMRRAGYYWRFFVVDE
jgi:hypothetical protein